MTYYFNNPNVWTPPHESNLLAVLVPENETAITTQERYIDLMILRLEWLIQHWMTHYEETQKATARLLNTALTNLDPNQYAPTLTETDGEAVPLETWRKAWAETLVRYNRTLVNRCAWQGGEFPSPVVTDKEEKENLLMMFQNSPEMEPTLEEWLMTLTTEATL